VRGFSAPVRLQTGLTHEELRFPMAHDTDPFNRWEAGQQLATDLLLSMVEDRQDGEDLELHPVIEKAFRAVLEDESLDPALAAQALSLPGEGYLAELVDLVDPEAIHEARDFMRRSLGTSLRPQFEGAYARNRVGGAYALDPLSIGRRALANLCLSYLMTQAAQAARRTAWTQFEDADNMTDSLAALGALSGHEVPERPKALAAFAEKWKDDELVMDKWFSIQAWSPLPGTLDEVKRLTEHPAFDLMNPNKVRALISAFAYGNPLAFNSADGAGYRFVADQIIAVGKANPQVAARLAGCFNRWTRFDGDRQLLMRAELERILAEPGLSPNVFEIVSKALEIESGEAVS